MTLGAYALSYVQRGLVTRDLKSGLFLFLFPCDPMWGNWNPTYAAAQLGPPSCTLTALPQQEGKKIRWKKSHGLRRRQGGQLAITIKGKTESMRRKLLNLLRIKIGLDSQRETNFKCHLSPTLPLSQDPSFLPPQWVAQGPREGQVLSFQQPLCALLLSWHISLIWSASCPGSRAFRKQPPGPVCSLHRLQVVWPSAPGAPIAFSFPGCGACRAAPYLFPQSMCHVLPLEHSFTPSIAERPGRMLRRGHGSRPSISSPQSLHSRWCYLCLQKRFLLHSIAFLPPPQNF